MEKSQLIDWQEAIRLKRKYGGWNGLARRLPEFSYNAYKQLAISDLGRAFVEEYAGPRLGKLQGKAFEIARDLKTLKVKNFPTFFMGSTEPDIHGTTDLNWRTSNEWDLTVKSLEESE